MAHKLDYDLQKSGVSEMAAALDTIPKHNYKKEVPLEVIKSFGPFAVGVLDANLKYAINKPNFLAEALRLAQRKKLKS